MGGRTVETKQGAGVREFRLEVRKRDTTETDRDGDRERLSDNVEHLWGG